MRLDDAAATPPNDHPPLSSDIDLLCHHRIERALGFIAAGRHRFGQHPRRDLPRHAPLVFAPAARALLAAIADDGVPIAVGLGLIVGGDQEREGFGVLERGPPLRPIRETPATLNSTTSTSPSCRMGSHGCTPDGAHRAVGKGLGIKSGSGLGILVGGLLAAGQFLQQRRPGLLLGLNEPDRVLRRQRVGVAAQRRACSVPPDCSERCAGRRLPSARWARASPAARPSQASPPT